MLTWLLRASAAAAAVCLIALCLVSDPARLSGGRFFSDGATYYSMGWSLVTDLDLEYQAADLARVRREYAEGPVGLFLKRSSGGFEFDTAAPWIKTVPAEEKRLYFGKAMTYPILAAPFVAALGTRGFLLFNAVCLLVAWACAFLEIRGRTGEGPALVASFGLIVATIAPIYVFWIQPEVMNLALVSLALLSWRHDRPMMSAILFGIAGYTKPTHLLMAAPLGLSPLWMTLKPMAGRLLEIARRGAVMVGCTAALFGANVLVTGEWNYQGGERKTFASEFPFDRGATRDVTFGNSGEWMTTMKLGPLEEGEKETLGAGIAQSPEELKSMFLANLKDFWIGRYAGMLPYFAAPFLALVAFLIIGPREKEGWVAVAGLLIFFIVSIRILPGPTNWYGGGGTVGNRYFMAALPLAIYFLPRGRELWVALPGIALSAAFLWPAWMQPVAHSIKPSLLASTPGGPLSFLPAERAMLNDLSFCTDPWRKKQPYDDADGDPPLHRPGSRHGYWLYFPDDGTFGREAVPGRFHGDGEPVEGFRVKRGQPTEALLRANEPIDWIDVTIFGTGRGDDVEVSAGSQGQRATIPTVGAAAFRIQPGPPVMYYDSFVYSVKVRSHATRGQGEASADPATSTLVSLGLHVSPRP